jgi:N-acetylglucosaminyldiphosphoundecaprenol N-acetyl-beta-D-mannosaminyltransferase
MIFFDLRFDDSSRARLEKLSRDALRNSIKYSIFKLNSEFINRSIKEEDFRKALNASTYNIIDGRGVQWAARFLTLPVSRQYIFRFLQSVWQMIYSGAAIVFSPGFLNYPISESIPGAEALEIMLAAATEKNAGVFFFGSSQEILKKSIMHLKSKFPGLKVSGNLNGYDFQHDSSIDPVKIINKTDAKLLVVALGSPKQEFWIHENLSKLNNIRVAVGEGGTLDRVARPEQLAPRWVNRIGLEWLWRLFFNKSQTESRNRFQRFWNSVPVFIYQVVKWKIVNGAVKHEN